MKNDESTSYCPTGMINAFTGWSVVAVMAANLHSARGPGFTTIPFNQSALKKMTPTPPPPWHKETRICVRAVELTAWKRPLGAEVGTTASERPRAWVTSR